MVAPGASSRRLQENFAVLPTDGDGALVVEPYFALNAVTVPAADLVVAGGGDFADPEQRLPLPGRLAEVDAALARPWAEGPVDGLVRALESRGLADGRLGVEFDGMPAETRAELERRLPRAELRDASNLLRLVRAVKSPAELERLERAAEIAEEAAAGAFALVAPGRTLGEVANAYRVGLAERGADLDHFAIGTRGLGIATAPELELLDGDFAFVDWGCSYRGYYSDTGTTLVVGTPSPRTLELYAAVRESVDAGGAAMRPGVRASVVCEAMWGALTARGISATNPHGHGFGLDVRDYPIVVRDNGLHIRDDCVDVASDLELEEGMVINLEAPVFLRGQGSVHCERSFVVTAAGARPLAAQDRSAPV
jgi:Xaa-Pro aminopeptidase